LKRTANGIFTAQQATNGGLIMITGKDYREFVEAFFMIAQVWDFQSINL
jgi:hypothetical protein